MTKYKQSWIKKRGEMKVNIWQNLSKAIKKKINEDEYLTENKQTIKKKDKWRRIWQKLRKAIKKKISEDAYLTENKQAIKQIPSKEKELRKFKHMIWVRLKKKDRWDYNKLSTQTL